MNIEILDPLYMGLSCLVALGSHIWGRNWVLWLLGSLIFSPVIAGIVLMISGDNK